MINGEINLINLMVIVCFLVAVLLSMCPGLLWKMVECNSFKGQHLVCCDVFPLVIFRPIFKHNFVFSTEHTLVFSSQTLSLCWPLILWWILCCIILLLQFDSVMWTYNGVMQRVQKILCLNCSICAHCSALTVSGSTHSQQHELCKSSLEQYHALWSQSQ